MNVDTLETRRQRKEEMESDIKIIRRYISGLPEHTHTHTYIYISIYLFIYIYIYTYI